MKFKKATATIGKERVSGYRVVNPGKSFRGLKVFLVKRYDRWHAYEKTTGLSITPSSWAGGFSNKTREGIMQIVANFLANQKSGWEIMQKQLAYPLNI